MSSQYLVEVQQENHLIKLAQSIGGVLDKDEEKVGSESQGELLKKDVQKGHASKSGLKVLQAFLSTLAVLFQKGTPELVDTALTFLCHFTVGLESDTKAGVDALIKGLVSKGDAMVDKRLKAALRLFNLLEDPGLRCNVLTALLQYALDSKAAKLVATALQGQQDKLMQEFKAQGVEGTARLLFLAGQVLQDSWQGQEKSPAQRELHLESLNLTTQALSLIPKSNKKLMEQYKQRATQTVLSFLKAPDLYHCDLMHIPAVQQLKGDPVYGAYYEVLNELLKDQVDWSAVDKFDALFEKEGISKEEYLAKMRMMSLLALGNKFLHSEVSIALVAKELDVSQADLEILIISAVRQKLMEVKIDQVEEVVTFRRCTYRAFGPQEWEQLQVDMRNVQVRVREFMAEMVAQESNPPTALHGGRNQGAVTY